MRPLRSEPRRFGSAFVVAAIALGSCSSGAGSPSSAPREATPVAGARADPCALAPVLLRRIERGYIADRSEDVIVVPRRPNYLGSFSLRSHSGPWRYLQRVPLVLYGPGHVASSDAVRRPVTLADVFPTIGRMMDLDLPDRTGEVLHEAVPDRSSRPPKLTLVVVWDGAGANVLTRWLKAWPTLAEMAAEGTAYWAATVGSSPSITPATHSTLGTGLFPRAHKVTSIKYRQPDGRIGVAFAGRDPSLLARSTFSDIVDRDHGNDSLVGLVGTRAWHMGMLGHGAAQTGGDKDHLVLMGLGGHVFGNHELYSLPSFLRDLPTFERRMREADVADGEADGLWRGHSMDNQHDNPGWAQFQTDIVLELMRQEGYGADAVPDMLFVNYKMTDIIGHQYSMESSEMRAVIAAQDAALKRLKSYLDRAVGDYAVVLTADHGHTPPTEVSGGWPILQRELAADINREFGVTGEASLVDTLTAVGVFLDRGVARREGVSPGEVAEFLAGYTIADGWPEPELPEGYEDRADELVYDAAFAGSDLDDVVACSGSAAGSR